MSLRNETTIIVLPYKLMFHFCNAELAGIANEAWYPYVEGELFKYVEKYLVAAGVAHNVTRIEELRRIAKSIDYKVIFNEAR